MKNTIDMFLKSIQYNYRLLEIHEILYDHYFDQQEL